MTFNRSRRRCPNPMMCQNCPRNRSNTYYTSQSITTNSIPVEKNDSLSACELSDSALPHSYEDPLATCELTEASLLPTPSLQESYEKDYLFLKGLCPSVVRKIQVQIDEECDKLEYAGSCMFDEFPDKVHLSTIINTIYNKVKDLDKEDLELQTEELSYNPLLGSPYRPCTGMCCPPPPPLSDYNLYGRPNWLRDLIEILLYNEIIYRRMRYRNYRKWN